ncbi:MAG: SdiA-regulated domain-containing protein [Zoogloeaceae bacterium]|nr:SdiA-regulated domain-containing protein [Zoogloeaceae bacterium]
MKIRRKSLFLLLALAVFASLFALAWHVKLPALLWYWAGTFYQARDWRHDSLWLPGYRVSVDALPIEGVSHNASGLTHDNRTNTLYLAINNPAEIVELSTEGRVLRRIPVHGVEDLEGVTHVEDDEFFLIDERHQRIYWISILPETTRIDVANAPQMGLGVLLNGNLGFEGVAWNSGRDLLFVAKEKAPPRIFHIAGLLPDSHDKPLNLQIQEWRPKVDPGRFLLDLSSLSLHDRTGHLLVLSDESRFLVEYGKNGELISMMPLWRGWHGLERSIPQAEGVTIDAQGALYIVSEPNLFYRFDPLRNAVGGS